MLITIIGSGRIGSSVASNIITRNIGDILLLDIIENLPRGEALDLGHMAAAYGVDVTVSGSNNFEDMNDSEIVVVTAGLSRKPGMTRLDLLNKNALIIADISRKIKEYSPKSKILMVTNPLDVMTYVALKTTGFESNKVFGMSGLLDSARFRFFISKTLNVPISAIDALVIGEHGESMLPLSRYSKVNGTILSEVASLEVVERIIKKTRETAAEVISLKGGTVHAPAVAIGEMVESVMKDRNKTMPISTYLNGEYGINDLCIGVPAILGKNGIKEIIEIKLLDEENKIFMSGVDYLRQAIDEIKRGNIL